MDRDEMFYSVNKGVPNYLTVPINVDTIIDYCASDKALLIQEMKAVRNQFTDEVFNIMQFAKSMLEIHLKFKGRSFCIQISCLFPYIM